MTVLATLQLYAPYLLAALGAAIVLFALFGAVIEIQERTRRHISRRIARHCRNEEVEPAGKSALQRLREEGSAALRPLVNAAAASLFAREGDRDKARKSLRRAGFTRNDALSALAVVKLVSALILAALSYIAMRRFGGEMDGFIATLLCLGMAIFGGIAPEILLAHMASARERRMRAALPDAIDLMVISAEAGQSLDMSLDRVAKELPLFAPDLSAELKLLNAELQLLSDRTQALRNFAERNEIAEFSVFATALIQSIRYGASFASTLKAMAADLRQARMLQAEEKAAKLPALLTIPLILFIMPPVFIVVAGPAILALMNAMGG